MTRIVILSPHIDDAAYSLAITMAYCLGRNHQVTVVNCFTKTNWTMKFVSKQWEIISEHRKSEDIRFFKNYPGKIEVLNLDLTDAPLREGYIWQTGDFSKAEMQLIGEIEKILQSLQPAIFFIPLAIGNHIDHALCRKAAEGLFDLFPIVFFEDLPYTQRISETEILAHVSTLENRLKAKLSSRIISCACCPFDKREALKVYDSQLTPEILQEIEKRKDVLDGERIWAQKEVLDRL